MKCEICGRKLKRFMHNCHNTVNYIEVYGCPYCDDNCGFCAEG